MKKFFIGLGIFAGFISVVIGFVFYLTSGATQAAESFFMELNESNFEAAYEQTSQAFKRETSLEHFENFTTQQQLNMYEKALWSSRSISGSQGSIEGTITLSDQSKLPMKIALLKEEGNWKINNLTIPAAGVSGLMAVPEQEVLEGLVYMTLSQFGGALEAKEFTAFYDSISELWKSQTSPEELQTIFQSFIDAELTYELGNAVPVFSQQPAINSDKVLMLEGYVILGETPLNFKLSYLQESTEWKLVGIDINF